jgi:adenine-specific DNA-methyltransferase
MRETETIQNLNSADETAKALGAFYTDTQVADFLVWWAVRSSSDTVMDPSFGGGVFLRSVCKRIQQMGGHPGNQVWGTELDPVVHARIAEKITDEFGVQRETLLQQDFFRLSPKAMPKVTAIVGNPPFIRYQRFTGESRKLALERSAAEGVRLSELSSSWAPFLVHCTALLRAGGRLGMVVPMEIAHAAYARPVLDHLHRSFRRVTFLTFRKKLFPDLSEDTLLLLAEDKGGQPSGFLWRDLSHVGLLTAMQEKDSRFLAGTRRLNALALSQGRERLAEHFIPAKARALYRELKGTLRIRRLGDLSDVGIGYVTGANDFFHLLPAEAERQGIPGRFLRPAVRRGRALSGLRFTAEDWRRAVEVGEGGYLLHINDSSELPESMRRYLQHGEEQGVPTAYKCRTRSPWFRVPHVYRPDGFLSYMSGTIPRLVANDAEVVAPNSLHLLRLHPGVSVSSSAIAALWQTSLARLSVEIEGHALGGGMLKVEPTEAENVVVPWPEDAEGTWLTALAQELDVSVRNNGDKTAQTLADEVILRTRLSLSQKDCAMQGVPPHELRRCRAVGRADTRSDDTTS